MDKIAGEATQSRLPSILKKLNSRWLWLLFVFLGAIAVIFAANYNFTNEFNSQMSGQPQIQKAANASYVRVTIDFGNGQKRAFEGKVDSPLVAGEVLRIVAETAAIPLKMTIAGDIAEINNFRNQSGKRWRWYLNGRLEERAISDVFVRGGDKILVKYE